MRLPPTACRWIRRAGAVLFVAWIGLIIVQIVALARGHPNFPFSRDTSSFVHPAVFVALLAGKILLSGSPRPDPSRGGEFGSARGLWPHARRPDAPASPGPRPGPRTPKA